MIIEIFLILVAVYLVSRIFKEKGNLPPGPNGIPFFGTFPYATIDEIIPVIQKYGKIFMIKTGVVNILYICDFKTSKEALSKLEFADRPSWKTMSFFEGEKMQGKAQGNDYS
ncbi:UNVERIFIED_CONTAM: hypothetical protein RMT77_019958 [Armadillidium vulgare]